MIDQSLVILGKHAQFSGCFQAKTKTCDVTFLLEAHGAQQFSQKFQTPPRIILIELLAQTSDIETRVNEFSRNLESVGAGFWILKRARVGGDRRVKIFRDVPSGRRLGKQLGPGKEGILLQHSIFIPYADIFSERLKRKRQSKLAAQRVAVRANVTQNGEAPMLA